ncbi:T9SS type A sorting domain-containing protein [Neolewinella persica]|uniref:T9SS type A sorting domain-containing protein n=1 Tax=Neolewinella persica TaxID=70998 RepID=UPI00035ED75D|nr:T9SS type A sorting domain-containing protein [Neolewinella persica]
MSQLYLKRYLLTAVFSLLTLTLLFSARIVVVSTADAGPGTLREAVAMAASGDTIRFNSRTLRQTIQLQSEIVIDKPLRIQGNGIGLTNIDGGGTTRAFNVSTEGFVYIGILKITNCATDGSGGAVKNEAGSLHLDGVEISSSSASGAELGMGGGAVHNGGALLITNSTFRDNTAIEGAGSGGALLNTAGGFSITKVNFIGNRSSRAGGAIEDTSGSGLSRVNLCTMTGNDAGTSPGNGGAIHITGGSDMRIAGGTYSNNTAAREGGALWNGSGVMTITKATINNNTASGPAADDGGGGVFNNGGTLRIFEGTTIADNVADGAAGSGGGVFNAVGGTLQLVGVQVLRNEANRAGGGIEDASGAGSVFSIAGSNIDSNIVNTSPGNGGGIHIGSTGSLSIFGGTVNGNQAGAEGGGIWNNTGNLVVSGTTVDGNVATGAAANQGGGGLFQNEGGGAITVKDNAVISNNKATGTSGSGGGILVDVDGTLTILNATISGNEANRAGGGIEDASGGATQLTITNGTISDNVVFNAPGNGGGIHVGGDGNISFRSGTVSGNQAGAEGGGIWIGSGTLTVGQKTIIDGNSAAGNDPDQGGGGLYSNGGGTMFIQNDVVISNNSATGTSGSGGGILNNTGATLRIDGAIIRNNSANRAGGGVEDVSGAGSTVLITQSTISDNTVGTAPGNGGGVHVSGDGDVTILYSNVMDNSAGSEGGGLWNNTGTMRVIKTNVEGNIALGDAGDNGGGGLFNNGGTMSLVEVTVADNDATGASGSGGGLFSTGGAVSVLKSDFTGNSANRAGGAVEQIDGSFSSSSTNYRNNTVGFAPGNGGAFHVTGNTSTVRFAKGEITNNTAGNEGGGLWNQAGTTMTVTGVSIMNNAVTGNAAGDGGGGIFNNGGMITVSNSTIARNAVDSLLTVGGGIFNKEGGDFTLNTSTVSGNTTGGLGGGIANDGTFTLVNSTIAFNSAFAGGGFSQVTPSAGLEISGTIISNNDATGDFWEDFSAGANSSVSLGFNFIGNDDQDNFVAVATDIEGGNANLAALADNGGATMTHALTCPSDAVDAGDAADVSADQRGEAVFGGTRDIGAFELQSNCAPFTGDGGTEFSLTNVVVGQDAVRLFPNPTAEQAVTVNLSDDFAGEVVLRLIDGNGRQRGVRTTRAGSAFRFPLQDLPNGTYVLQVIDGDNVVSRRLVIAR